MRERDDTHIQWSEVKQNVFPSVSQTCEETLEPKKKRVSEKADQSLAGKYHFYQDDWSKISLVERMKFTNIEWD